MTIAEESEYKGNPVLILKNNEDDRYPFTFGLKKAKLVVEHIKDVEKFVEKHDKEQPPPPEEKEE